MSTPERAAHNFCRVSARDELAFGSSRPGFPSKTVDAASIAEWSAFMKEQGVQRVLSLLGDDEKAFFATDIDAAMAEHFGSGKYARTSVFSADAKQVMANAIKAARESDEKIVIHCSGGEGRATLGMMLWLVEVYGVSTEVAATEVEEETERHVGVARKANREKIAFLVQNGTMTGFKK